jgi:hypothetical protein
LNPAFVEALFPNEEDEDIFFSFSSLGFTHLFHGVLPSIAALTRIRILNCATSYHSCNIKTLFNQLLLASKHGRGVVDTVHFLSYSTSDPTPPGRMLTPVDVIKVA